MKDFDDSAVVLAVPRGCEARTLREFFESYPALGVAVADMPWTYTQDAIAPFLVLINPALSRDGVPQ